MEPPSGQNVTIRPGGDVVLLDNPMDNPEIREKPGLFDRPPASERVPSSSGQDIDVVPVSGGPPPSWLDVSKKLLSLAFVNAKI